MPLVAPLALLQTLTALPLMEAAAGADPVEIVASKLRFVEARWTETVVRGRPWVPHRRVATVASGTRFAVRGEVPSRDDEGCHGKAWYAVLPFGFVCSEHVRAIEAPPPLTGALPVASGKRLPHSYAIVREDGIPEYASAEQASLGVPERTLTKSMSMVVRRTLEIEGALYVETAQGKIVPKEGVGWMGQGSEHRGVALDAEPGARPLLAWVLADKTPVKREPDADAETVSTLKRRERVLLLEGSVGTPPAWWRVGDQAWVSAAALAEAHAIDPPAGVLDEARVRESGNDQWIDVDVGEQVLVAYRDRRPVFATVVSSGRSSPTPLGNYPVWAKVASMDMANQDYEDKPYMVQGVPWVLLFQGHNALHGAYWHDRFGVRRSHGCVNLAPLDARWVFEWVGPTMPQGWTGILPPDLEHSPVVHVRDTSRARGVEFAQERPIGPPDQAAERRKLEAAEKRRSEDAAASEVEPDTGELPVGAPIWPD